MAAEGKRGGRIIFLPPRDLYIALSRSFHALEMYVIKRIAWISRIDSIIR